MRIFSITLIRKSAQTKEPRQKTQEGEKVKRQREKVKNKVKMWLILAKEGTEDAENSIIFNHGYPFGRHKYLGHRLTRIYPVLESFHIRMFKWHKKNTKFQGCGDSRETL